MKYCNENKTIKPKKAQGNDGINGKIVKGTKLDASGKLSFHSLYFF